jgi:hypothetical protein
MGKRLVAPELFHYLVALSEVLAKNGDAALSQRVLHVSKFASGSASELYGEALLLLPVVLVEAGEVLPGPDAARLREIISLIKNEFRLIGGA